MIFITLKKTKTGKNRAYRVDIREGIKRPLKIDEAERLIIKGEAKIVTQDQIPVVYKGCY
jgi:hypothetical protein|tara:strand:+ start:302 stop:481 length:180 start_codon:yes stop_codon:yes gene_type:complete